MKRMIKADQDIFGSKVVDGTDSMLEDAYNGSWFTIEGAGGDINDWVNGITEELEKLKIGTPKEWIVFKGKQISDHWDFVDRYPDDLTVLCFPLDGLNAGKLAMYKLQLGARWFDDIVDNSRGDIQE